MRQLVPLPVLLVLNNLNYEYGFLTTKKSGYQSGINL